MATGKSNCEIVNCHRAASACCFCCKNNVCTSHFVEHIERVKARIDPLANEANNVMEKVQRLSVDQLSRPVYTELNQWRKEMHEFIDDIHQSSMKEIEEMLNKNKQKFNEHQEEQSEAMMKLQDDVKQLAEDGDVTLERIESFENQLQAVGTSLDVFEKSFLSIKTQPLKGKLVFISSNLQQATNNVDKTQATPVYNPGMLLSLVRRNMISCS